MKYADGLSSMLTRYHKVVSHLNDAEVTRINNNINNINNNIS